MEGRDIMNSVSIIGRLTRDAELIDFNDLLKKGIKFTLAVDRSRKNADGEKVADFIPVVYFTEHWEKLQPCLTKGKLISVHGKLAYRSYMDSNNMKKSSIDVVADDIEFLESKQKSNAV